MKGQGKVCPRDGKEGCSVVDALDSEKCGKAGKVHPWSYGDYPLTRCVVKATHFLSWVWQYKLSAFIAAIRQWIEQEGLVWMQCIDLPVIAC